MCTTKIKKSAELYHRNISAHITACDLYDFLGSQQTCFKSHKFKRKWSKDRPEVKLRGMFFKNKYATSATYHISKKKFPPESKLYENLLQIIRNWCDDKSKISSPMKRMTFWHYFSTHLFWKIDFIINIFYTIFLW